MTLKSEARARVLAAKPALVALARRIHAHPELGFEEVRASAWLCEALDDAGLRVERGVGDLPTAFSARVGSGPLHLAVCAEYDALPGIGHACGHNLIAAMAVGVAGALAPFADDAGFTLHVIGTPAEEFGNGKAALLERGAFDGIHAAVMTHPAPIDVLEPPLLAFAQFDVEYADGSAGTDTPRGSRAADALTVAQVAIGLLRQHLRMTDRVHGITTAGGDPVTFEAMRARAIYMVRARNLDEFDEAHRRVMRCFEAGAVATGTSLEVLPAHAPYAEMRHDARLARVYARNALALGRSFPDIGDVLDRGAGSTDMGNVSLAIPAIHPAIGLDCLPIANHQPEFAERCIGPIADETLVDGAVALAWTILDVAADRDLSLALVEGQSERDDG